MKKQIFSRFLFYVLLCKTVAVYTLFTCYFTTIFLPLRMYMPFLSCDVVDFLPTN